MSLVFVDCEARGPCPGMGALTEFGAVEYVPLKDPRRCLYFPRTDPGPIGRTFYGKIYDSGSGNLVQVADPEAVFRAFDLWLVDLDAGSGLSFVSDNPAFDWMWICDGLWRYTGRNRFGHSARRIGDFYAGLIGDFRNTQRWKRLRVTAHDHNPVHDAIGNVEAFDRMLRGERA